LPRYPRIPIKLAVASSSQTLTPAFLERFDEIAPDLELWVISEFPPPRGRWIPYRFDRTFRYNLNRTKHMLREHHIQYAAVMLEPSMPYHRLRLLAVFLRPLRTLIYNENLDHYMLRPRSLMQMSKHVSWRAKDYLRWQLRPGGNWYTWAWRSIHPRELLRPLWRTQALVAGHKIATRKRQMPLRSVPALAEPLPHGISVVIPSRNGKALLERLLPVLRRELQALADKDIDSEVLIVDNGSCDGSAGLVREFGLEPLISKEPLSFARAVNLGIEAAQYSRVCLLNNDMVPHEGFFTPLLEAFEKVPDLFCATAQIFFPEGRRREETGKTFFRASERTHFPVACQEPIPGEDLSYVLYGSGGCSVIDTAKLRALEGIGEVYEPAYVEDLDIGVRAWQCGWPTVFVARAHATHDHRSTTTRYYSEEELERVLEINYLVFLARTIGSPEFFRKLWRVAIERLNTRAAIEKHEASLHALDAAQSVAAFTQPAFAKFDEQIFALGDVAVFPGHAKRLGRFAVVASCYIPFPLSHGGAVRMYNLMRRSAAAYSQVLITFVDELHTPPPELLDICVEVVQVKRVGSHVKTDQGRPDGVEDFDSPAFHLALRQTVRKWNAGLVQLEFTPMAQYAADCAPARTVLVEHDITIDLYKQLLKLQEDWEVRDQLARWEHFETQAWQQVDCVVTMCEKDKHTVKNARRVATLANGVDLQHFRPVQQEPKRHRVLFIGSFAHLPNLLALDFFLHDVWPLLADLRPTLHVIAGMQHAYHHERHRDRIGFSLTAPDVKIEGFVADVRPAYADACVVVAPLLASAGTNIKIMEAMAMGKAIVSTSSGVNGLTGVTPGKDLLVENDAQPMAKSIRKVLCHPEERQRLEREARATVERVYGWNSIAHEQNALYDELFRL
jgi:GT2 family glycosyltransferase/glycosyltransferase involved in cell wall biosynthesis